MLAALFCPLTFHLDPILYHEICQAGKRRSFLYIISNLRPNTFVALIISDAFRREILFIIPVDCICQLLGIRFFIIITEFCTQPFFIIPYFIQNVLIYRLAIDIYFWII